MISLGTCSKEETLWPSPDLDLAVTLRPMTKFWVSGENPTPTLNTYRQCRKTDTNTRFSGVTNVRQRHQDFWVSENPTPTLTPYFILLFILSIFLLFKNQTIGILWSICRLLSLNICTIIHSFGTGVWIYSFFLFEFRNSFTEFGLIIILGSEIFLPNACHYILYKLWDWINNIYMPYLTEFHYTFYIWVLRNIC